MQDITPPELVSFSFSPKKLDVRDGTKEVTVDAVATDTGSGVDYIQMRFESPNDVWFYATFRPDEQGEFSSQTIDIPDYAADGVFTVDYFVIKDVAGNRTNLSTSQLKNEGYLTELNVVNDSTADVTPPELVSFSFSPKELDVRDGTKEVTVDAVATDTGSGVDYIQMRFESPNDVWFYATFRPDEQGEFSSQTIDIPDYAADGVFTVDYFVIKDVAGNRTNLSTSQLKNEGYPTELNVVNATDIASSDSAETVMGKSVVIDVLANDIKPDGGNLTISGLSQPDNGSGTIQNGTIKYTPADGFTGQDSFSYTVSDGNGGTDTAKITVKVGQGNQAPAPAKDSAQTTPGQAVTVDVLANDSDPDGDELSIQGASEPANGTVAIADDGTVDYTPDASFTGEDSFSYTVSDGNGGTDTAVVSVSVEAQNQPPVASDDQASTSPGTAVTVDVLANDTDPDGDTQSVASVTNPANGTTSITPDDEVRYTPADGFTGQDSFSYTVSDGNSGTDTTLVSVMVESFQFFQMPEVDQVAAVYVGYFGRAPDSAGRDFWLSDLNDSVAQGVSPAATAEEMASGFRFSDEAQDIYPFLDPAVSQSASGTQVDAFVDDVFDNLFNRNPDEAGKDFWTGEIQARLSAGETIGDVIVDVMAGASGDDVRTLQNKIHVANNYTDTISNFNAEDSVGIVGSVGNTEESVSQALAQIG